ncbi:Acetyltransferase (GNAT) domain-containing protein [Flexibacter flexilis DSM 6793]|uniref:Acetyltransferase (GNAT) domain-containing protein n=1 Tax=Flexibacter flexilis DSM 6793 TaxID=927664 RepID=A0A1I1E3V3_9BACT|nr:GNAT family N-acetyltransferase [Flexibacter flexilis]SFB81332.1 Acetyltransferase (GNAT) domain-containing protein [Flexibacter flexilis DSM 6793]
MPYAPTFFFYSPRYTDWLRAQIPQQLQRWQTPEACLLAWYNTDKKQLTSTVRASFGGIEATTHANFATHQYLYGQLLDWAKAQGATQIKVVLPPECYAPNVAWQAEILRELGFELLYQDLNFHWEITPEPVQTRWSGQARWKLSKSQRMGWTVTRVSNPDLAKTYDFILASRARKGFELSMSQADFVAQCTQFPHDYQVFEVRNAAGELLANAVTLAVSEQVLYVFYTADAPQARALSPVLLLHAGIYAYAQAQGFGYLDLGTASLQGIVNEGVAHFKQTALGARPTPKYTFLKKLV